MDVLATLQRTLGDGLRIQRELAGGGMSRVFVVRDEALGRDVVLKVLLPELAQGLSAERFTREIKLAAGLQEPHIVPLLSAGQTLDGLPFYTMPFVKGDSLRARMNSGRVPLGEATSILSDVARALAYAHVNGVVHRDIKPENVLLSSGTAVVADFGIAKALTAAKDVSTMGLTSAGTSIGTPAYMAPEQAAGDTSTDHRADIYAWGVVAYELLSGAHPFADKKTPHALMTAHFTETPVPLTPSRNDVPVALGALVQRCLEKNPANRPQTAQELVQSLDATRAHGGAAPRLSGARMRATATVAIVAIVTGVAAFTMRSKRAASNDGADRSVAVIPFENSGRDSTQEYFSDGLTDELIGRLATTGLRVSGRNSAFTFKGRHASAREVGSTLGVRTVLSGRVSRLGDKLHVSAELASASNDSVLWTFNADRQTSDVFAVQQEIVESIIAHFHVVPARPTIVGDGRTTNSAAHDLYLRGKFRQNKLTNGELLAAIATYDSALVLDPTYALAWVGKASVYTNLADGYLPPDVAYPKSADAVRRAMALDSTLAESWVVAADIDVLYFWNWRRAKTYLDRARAAGLQSSDLVFVEAGYWSGVRRMDKMMAAFAEAGRLDPLSPLIATMRLATWTQKGAPDSGIAFWEKLPAEMRAVMYVDAYYAIALTDRGDFARAEREFANAAPALGHLSPGLGVLYTRTGRVPEARRLLDDIERSWPATYIAPEEVAQLPAALGDTASMYRWLERGVKIHSAWATGLWSWTSAFGKYLQQPHFQDILRRVHDAPAAT